MRAREPDASGYVERDGVRVHYEVHGDGPHPIVFTPADTIVDARMWKAQVAYLARHHRVVVIDPRGNGLSDRPVGPEHYTDLLAVGDLLAVMDVAGIEEAVVVGLCDSAWYGLLAAARHPARVAGVVAIAPGADDGTPKHDRGLDTAANWTADLIDPQGWQLYNEGVWRRDWPAYPRWFFSQICNDPHSTKIYEDVVDWACQTSGEVMLSLRSAEFVGDDPASVAETLASIACPVLVVHGSRDLCQPFARGVHMARLAGAELLVLDGAGHLPQARFPVAVNHAIHDFTDRVARGTATRHHGSVPVRIVPSAPKESAMKARQPDVTGYVERGGVRVAWQMYGDLYRILAQAGPEGLPHSFAEEFSKAYEIASSELKDRNRRLRGPRGAGSG